MTARILIVEDEELLKEAYCAYLKIADEHFLIQSAATADTAIALYEQHEFDICVLDWWLPNGGGEAVFNHIIKEPNNCSFIIASGITDHISDDYLQHEKVTAILPKPFPLHELFTHIRDTLDGSMSLQG